LSAEKDKSQTLIDGRKMPDSSNHPGHCTSLRPIDYGQTASISSTDIEPYIQSSWMMSSSPYGGCTTTSFHPLPGATGSRARLADERTLHGRTIIYYTSEVLGENSLAKIMAVIRERPGGAATTTEASCTVHCDGRGERGRGIRGRRTGKDLGVYYYGKGSRWEKGR
jgi:hypothetical protein